MERTVSLAAWHLLRHVCEYVGHHTRPAGRGCRDEAMASLTLYSTEARRVRKQPKDSPRAVSPAEGLEPREQ